MCSKEARELPELVRAAVDDRILEVAVRDAVGRAAQPVDPACVQHCGREADRRGEHEPDQAGRQDATLHGAHGGKRVGERRGQQQHELAVLPERDGDVDVLRAVTRHETLGGALGAQRAEPHSVRSRLGAGSPSSESSIRRSTPSPRSSRMKAREFDAVPADCTMSRVSSAPGPVRRLVS